MNSLFHIYIMCMVFGTSKHINYSKIIICFGLSANCRMNVSRSAQLSSVYYLLKKNYNQSYDIYGSVCNIFHIKLFRRNKN